MGPKTGRAPLVDLWGDSLTEGRPGVAFAPILSRALPGVEIRNFGRGGDTVLSLLKRAKAAPRHPRPDAIVLWVGTNDVLADLYPGFRFLKAAVGQPSLRADDPFAREFGRVLRLLSKRADRLLVLPPLFIGEDPATERNRRLAALGDLMRGLCEGSDGAEFLDIRPLLPLDSAEPSRFLPVNPLPKLVEGIRPGDDEAYDRAARRRGLRWTFDGVHLNGDGAAAVAKALAGALEGTLRRAGSTPRNAAARKTAERLGLEPHAEGGWFREEYRKEGGGERPLATSITFLLEEGNFSALHRLASDELWFHHDGHPLDVEILRADGSRETLRIGPASGGHRPWAPVPAGCWFGSRVAPGGSWSLVSCVVVPGFDYADFELARRDDLTAQFPGHAEFIRSLTRD